MAAAGRWRRYLASVAPAVKTVDYEIFNLASLHELDEEHPPPRAFGPGEWSGFARRRRVGDGAQGAAVAGDCRGSVSTPNFPLSAG